MPEWVWKMALNTKMEGENMTQKAWRSSPNGTKRQKWREIEMDLNVEWKKRREDSECQTENVALNTEKTSNLNIKLKVWLWTPNWRYGSECRTEEIHDGSECQTGNKQRL